MSKNKIALTLGIWVALVGFLGFPSSWETVIYIVSGVIIASLGLFGRERRKISVRPKRRKEVVTDMFVENTMPQSQSQGIPSTMTHMVHNETAKE